MPLIDVALPPLHPLGPEPRLPAEIYERRIAALRRRMAHAGLDVLIVYADREHFANAAHLSGFDPRFEEALLVVAMDGDPVILAGNESIASCPDAGLPVRGILCQSFSLPSQDRSQRRRLADALAEADVPRDARAGVVGWKPIPREDAPAARLALAVPQFVLSELEHHLTVDLTDATELVCGLDGLRTENEADALALAEHRATRASHHVWRALEALEPGRSEREVAAAMGLSGIPLSCHVMCTSGVEGFNGLRSPEDRVIERGDRFSTAVGLWGGLACRAGIVLDRSDAEAEAYVSRFAEPYVRGVRRWYELVAVGAVGGEVSDAVRETLGAAGLRALLDAGHLTHLDEWLHSPFFPGSTHVLRSGMALQCDIIPAAERHPLDVANLEDSLALADADLRAELEERHPAMWSRVLARRSFMREELGMEVSDEVLPFCDRQAILPAALLSLDAAVIPAR
jgi:hypothetical protein